ncbi:hypothetical protein [Saliphagus infecundisoli]|uniref:DUF7968 domain-containing protein n=1 Tax=Saliphagus infecundisoli TaxID=1849069 RepID=A0ABD5QFV4_9EURY|nr:hypothetical protein [Saliphagus infecundisoli]
MSDRDGVAATVVVSYGPAADGIGDALGEPSYRRYLRRAHEGRVAAGEEWPEFVSRGCGSRAEVVLRIERVESGSRIGEDTAVEFVPR